MDVSFVAYPETVYSRKYHYAVYMVGKTPLTVCIIKPAMIDAKTEANGKLRVVGYDCRIIVSDNGARRLAYACLDCVRYSGLRDV